MISKIYGMNRINKFCFKRDLIDDGSNETCGLYIEENWYIKISIGASVFENWSKSSSKRVKIEGSKLLLNKLSFVKWMPE